MSLILRGITERFNPQIHTEEKSLTVNMNKHMAVKKKTFELFANKNKFISFLYATDRVNMGALAGKVMVPRDQNLPDNAYRIRYEGSLFIPAYAFGKCQMGSLYTTNTDMSGLTGAVTYTGGVANAAAVVHNVVGTLAVKHDPANNIFGDKFNEGDVIAPGGPHGARFIVMGKPVKSSAGTHYLVNFKVNSATGKFDDSFLAADELLPEYGNRFGEGSMRGYQRERRSTWRINYSFISRATLTMTGSAMNQQVQWLESNGEKMWEYKQVLDLRERHAINMELGARYARTSMDPSSHSWFENYGTNKLDLTGFTADYGLVAPVIGDGWITQLEDSFTVTYDPNSDIPLQLLEFFITVLSQRSPIGSTGNTFIILGDKLGHIKIDKAIKAAIGWTSDAAATIKGNTNVVVSVKTGQSVKVGFEVHEYEYLNNKLIFIEDDLKSNPAFFAQNGGIIGDGTMYVLNASPVDGVSNIDLLARNNRALRQVYVDGMHSLNPKNQNNTYAASGFDGARVDVLSEVLPIIYSTVSCGIIKASAKFTGGPLSAQPIASEKATVWQY